MTSTHPLTQGLSRGQIRRIAVVGVTGSGKSTLADTLARRLCLARVEIDALFWQPGWQEPDRQEFNARLSAALPADGAWACDGNYGETRPLVWSRAQAVIWLDYPLAVCLWRVTVRTRTLQRIRSRELLWGSNRETWREAFFSPDSLLLYAVTSQKKLRASLPAALAQPAYAHLLSLRLPSPRATAEFLKDIV